MRRWTDLQRELNGHKRKLANKKHEVSLKEAPWEEEEAEDKDLIATRTQPIYKLQTNGE